MPLFVITNQSITNPLATDATNSVTVPHNSQHTLENNEVAALGTFFNPTAGQTNLPQITSSATGSAVVLGAAGTDSNISITISPKGTGGITLSGAVTVPSISVSAITAGSLLFAGSSGAVGQDNARLFWDDTNYRLGIRTASPAEALDIAYGNLRFTSLSTPSAPSAALAGLGAGNLGNGVYSYKVSFITAAGETNVSSASSTVTTSSGNGQVALSSIPVDSNGYATGRKIYRTLVGGSTYFLLTTLANNTATTYADNTADASISGNAAAVGDDTSTGWLYIGTNKAMHLGVSTIIGQQAGSNLTSGYENVFIGQDAGQHNTSAIGNTLVGWAAGAAITTGGGNSCMGSAVGGTLTTGTSNTLLGSSAGSHLVSGSQNVYVGYLAGTLGTGGSNTAIGAFAGQNLTTGVNNTALGEGAGPGSSSGAITGSIALGAAATTTASNQLVIGGSGVQISSAYIGSGVTDTSPASIVLNATGGSGTNIAGASFTLAGGQGTGSAAGGDLILAAAPAGTSGTSLNALKSYITLKSTGSLVLATAALGTGATDGFPYIPTCAGLPTGTPTSFTGTVAIVYDTTDDKLCVYNGAWKAVVLS